MNYIIPSEFSFSQKAIDWIRPKFFKLCQRQFHHDLYPFIDSNIMKMSPIGKELINFLKSKKIIPGTISTFVSNSTDYFIGNPHIDFKHLGSILKPIESRFNVLLIGNASDKMVWWDTDIQLKEQKFTTLDNAEYTSLAVPGEDPIERWHNLGSPKFTTDLMSETGYFVRTDCIHTVSVSPGPRLVITVELDMDMNMIDKFLN